MRFSITLLALVFLWPAVVAASDVPQASAQVVLEDGGFVRLSLSVNRAQFPEGTTHYTLRFREPWPDGSVEECPERSDPRTKPFDPLHTFPSGPSFRVDLKFRLPWDSRGRRSVALSSLLPLVFDEAGNEVHLPLSVSYESRGHTHLELEGLTPGGKSIQVTDIFAPGEQRFVQQLRPEPAVSPLVRDLTSDRWQGGLGAGLALSTIRGVPLQGLVYGECWVYGVDLRLDFFVAGADSRFEPRVGPRLRLGHDEDIDLSLGAGPSIRFDGAPVRASISLGVALSVVGLSVAVRTGSQPDVTVTAWLDVGQLLWLGARLAIGFGTS